MPSPTKTISTKSLDAVFALRAVCANLEAAAPVRSLGREVAVLCHDIKNRALVISSYAALLSNSKNLDENEREMVNAITASATELHERCAAVSNVSKLAASRGGGSEFVLGDVFRDAAADYDGVKFNIVDNGVTTIGDPDAYKMMTIAAFENAVEAGAKNIFAEVTECNRMAVVVIEDDGIGCDVATINNMPKTFFTTKNDPLAGIGLPLIRSAVEAHNGTLCVYSKNILGGGAHGLSIQFAVGIGGKTEHKTPPTEFMLITDDLDGANRRVSDEAMRVFKNLKITPHVVKNFSDFDFAARSATIASAGVMIRLVVLCGSGARGADSVCGIDGVNVYILECVDGGVVATNRDSGARLLFTEDFIAKQ